LKFDSIAWAISIADNEVETWERFINVVMSVPLRPISA